MPPLSLSSGTLNLKFMQRAKSTPPVTPVSTSITARPAVSTEVESLDLGSHTPSGTAEEMKVTSVQLGIEQAAKWSLPRKKESGKKVGNKVELEGSYMDFIGSTEGRKAFGRLEKKEKGEDDQGDEEETEEIQVGKKEEKVEEVVRVKSQPTKKRKEQTAFEKRRFLRPGELTSEQDGEDDIPSTQNPTSSVPSITDRPMVSKTIVGNDKTHKFISLETVEKGKVLTSEHEEYNVDAEQNTSIPFDAKESGVGGKARSVVKEGGNEVTVRLNNSEVKKKDLATDVKIGITKSVTSLESIAQLVNVSTPKEDGKVRRKRDRKPKVVTNNSTDILTGDVKPLKGDMVSETQENGNGSGNGRRRRKRKSDTLPGSNIDNNTTKDGESTGKNQKASLEDTPGESTKVGVIHNKKRKKELKMVIPQTLEEGEIVIKKKDQGQEKVNPDKALNEDGGILVKRGIKDDDLVSEKEEEIKNEQTKRKRRRKRSKKIDGKNEE
ncbi:hypothetical protein TREMEDRAFT_64949 [Tremella mesenterica DSM 1558]|uniref:uncharacterized protein n=1 Tax=Tremella mesenterica (strain ATCC 24925 / CBS 8224 / DSM 1558 / NBRC 9311 / NRRL Y-6157 / RJB 2259-6 / UBC 559-6) TaxID=578456 RepID=UPI0003F4A406|nr:uncharacterized protein TREMEDRAFT_64949 [Tremella mesenterica DSM 1558]EIW67080.1 hypothetical protein TREMEDRAFT_64949 [Tremella mesenterica DSM 1558]